MSKRTERFIVLVSLITLLSTFCFIHCNISADNKGALGKENGFSLLGIGDMASIFFKPAYYTEFEESSKTPNFEKYNIVSPLANVNANFIYSNIKMWTLFINLLCVLSIQALTIKFRQLKDGKT
ncbi:MAG: hypothetical protein Q8873_02625 [Bacillota bacterium]|nr:hypothetical protein [Bacillota bacterium]